MTTPAWSGAQNGATGSLNATNQAGQIDQLLGAHAISAAYDGTRVLTPTGSTQFTWLSTGNATDLDQPFVLSGTTIGRVTLPITTVGNGANVLVTLYPDNGSGAPNLTSPLASTLVTAEELRQVAASNGIDGTQPLANEDSNSGYLTGSIISTPWARPSASGGGSAQLDSSFVSDGNYFIAAGGQDNSGIAQNGVATVQYLGGGVVALPIPQPSLPAAVNGPAVVVCNGCVVSIGGATGAISTNPSTLVFVASWDSNNGIIGTWSSQTAYPLGVVLANGVGYGNYIYVIGGYTGSGPTLINSVYSASVTNGQISAWQALPGFPIPINSVLLTAVNGWLIAMGGLDASFVIQSTTYYAQIIGDGTIGPWQTGPTLPFPTNAFSPGFSCLTAGDLVGTVAGGNGSITGSATMAVTANGLGTWQKYNWSSGGDFPVAAFPSGQGQYDVVAVRVDQGTTEYSSLLPVPMVSVPLCAGGLTNGGTYHVVMRQFQNKSSSDYLQFGVLNGTPLPLNALTANRHSSTWSTYAATWSVPMSVYDASPVGNLRHMWQDPDVYNTAHQVTSILYDNVGLPIGTLENTLKVNGPFNANPTFTSGVSPWTATGGTITQSNAQVHGGFAFSGLLTPDGVSAQAVALSELFPVLQGDGPFYGASQWLLLDGWFYSPPGTTAFSFSINWYDRLGTFLSTSSSTITLAAATWTHVQNYFEVPATAAQGQLAPTESGTPANTKLIYCSNVFAIKSWECVGAFTSAATVNYGASPWPPTGITQLN